MRLWGIQATNNGYALRDTGKIICDIYNFSYYFCIDENFTRTTMQGST